MSIPIYIIYIFLNWKGKKNQNSFIVLQLLQIKLDLPSLKKNRVECSLRIQTEEFPVERKLMPPCTNEN